MSLVQGWGERLRSLLFRSRHEAEMEEELRFHLEQEAELLRASGLEPREAMRQARLRFGGVDRFREEVRDARGTAVVDCLSRDVRYSLRRLLRDWRFTVPAVLLLALGIGANTAMFSVVNAALFQPQPFADAGRLVNIYQNVGESRQPSASSYPAYLDMAAYTDLFSGVVAFSGPAAVRYQTAETIRRGSAEYTTPNYLTVQGLGASMGRWFTKQEDQVGVDPVVIVGHHFFTAELGAEPSVIGRTIRLNGVAATIIGVGPEDYSGGFHSGLLTDFFLPISAATSVAGKDDDWWQLREFSWEHAVQVRARLREGVDLPQAQAGMTALGARLAKEYPDEDRGRGISVLPTSEVLVHPQGDAFLSAGASFLMIVVGLVLAIACTNLATWLLVRGLARAKEISVRLALGATRAQVVRHLLVESTLLAGIGGALGYLLAEWAIRLLALADLPIDFRGGLDYRVLGFALALALFTGVTFGLGPALKATRVTLTPGLRSDGDSLDPNPGRFNLKNALVISQVALSCVLLVGEGVYLRYLSATQAVDLGFEVEGLAFVQTDARFAGYTADEAVLLHETLLERISALPGVELATLAVRPPPSWQQDTRLSIDGYEPGEDEELDVRWIIAGLDYFEVLGVSPLHGRTFTDADRMDTPAVAVINETMARRYFGAPNAVGRHFRLEEEEGEPSVELEVIGVVPDLLTSVQDLSWQPRPAFYRFYRQGRAMTPTVIARTRTEPTGVLAEMRSEVQKLDQALPIITVKTLSQHLSDLFGVRHQLGALLGVLGALGLGLASLGLYVVVGFAVSRRSREIGIRTTFGAHRGQVIWTISKSVSKLLAIGVLIGLALSWLLLEVLSTVVFRLDRAESFDLGVAPTADPLTFLLVMLLMTVVGLAATFLPVWRATRDNPLTALRDL